MLIAAVQDWNVHIAVLQAVIGRNKESAEVSTYLSDDLIRQLDLAREEREERLTEITSILHGTLEQVEREGEQKDDEEKPNKDDYELLTLGDQVFDLVGGLGARTLMPCSSTTQPSAISMSPKSIEILGMSLLNVEFSSGDVDDITDWDSISNSTKDSIEITKAKMTRYTSALSC
jgi:hypothetical protein